MPRHGTTLGPAETLWRAQSKQITLVDMFPRHVLAAASASSGSVPRKDGVEGTTRSVHKLAKIRDARIFWFSDPFAKSLHNLPKDTIAVSNNGLLSGQCAPILSVPLSTSTPATSVTTTRCKCRLSATMSLTIQIGVADCKSNSKGSPAKPWTRTRTMADLISVSISSAKMATELRWAS